MKMMMMMMMMMMMIMSNRQVLTGSARTQVNIIY